MNRRLPVSPYARRLAAERGVALDGLVGSGPGGRLVAADIPSRPAANIPAAPAAPSPEPLACLSLPWRQPSCFPPCMARRRHFRR